jgi:hypothetical protein
MARDSRGWLAATGPVCHLCPRYYPGALMVLGAIFSELRERERSLSLAVVATDELEAADPIRFPIGRPELDRSAIASSFSVGGG